MKPIPEEVRESMERARECRTRYYRETPGCYSPGAALLRQACARSDFRASRTKTRAIVAALGAAKMHQEAGISLGQ